MDAHKMADYHLTAGIIFLILLVIAGMITKLISIQAGIILNIIIFMLSPLMFLLIHNVRKHDDNIHYHDNDKW